MMRKAVLLLGIVVACNLVAATWGYAPPIPPAFSPATKLPNQLYTWRGNQQIRYQVAGPENGEPVVLVHGLFVNSDHWRKTIRFLANEGYRAYAIDMWGSGYSSKPPRDCPEAQAVNGEHRFDQCDHPPVMRSVLLGTASGRDVRIRDVELKHPLGSPYNFFTWSELVTDFCRDIVLADDGNDKHATLSSSGRVTLVANSIGCISAFQAVLDQPDLYRGVFAISPNFRELHSAEVSFPKLVMPILRQNQKLLREKGQGLYDFLAKPGIVKEILKEPYAVVSEVDDVLVQVLLDPLLTEGASKVVFDTLSYSAGPLPEPQLESIPAEKPVWICYGKDDPWTPSGRVEALKSKRCVERVVGWYGVGHCPHDEAPELVNPLLKEFLDRTCRSKKEPCQTDVVCEDVVVQ